MEWLDYLVLSFCIIAFALLIFTVAQILLLRSRIRGMYTQMATSEDRIKTSMLDSVDATNKLQVYGVKINNAFTKLLTSYSVAFDLAKPFLLPYSRFYTLTCEKKIRTKEVKYTAAAIMVLEDNSASLQLQKDILNGNIRYLLVSNVLFDVRHSPAIEDELKKALTNDKKLSLLFRGIHSYRMIMLYSPQYETSTATCTFDPKLFTGPVNVPGAVNGCLQLGTMLELSTADSTPLYVMAYMTPK